MTPHFPDVIDSSMLAEFKSCPHKFYNSYILDLKPKGKSVHLHAGGAFAKGMEATRRAFYEANKSVDDSIAAGLQALLLAYGDFECPADSAKSAVNMAGAFEFYWSRYPLGGDGTEPIRLDSGRRGIEFSFAHPLPISHPVTGDPLLYSGKMDAILHHKPIGGQFITDEKTTTQLGASWDGQWDLRSQFTGYAWGCRESGIRVDGVIVRGVSILKTKFDTRQAIVYRPEHHVVRWYEEMLSWIEDIKLCWERSKWKHNLDHSCAEYGGCSFKQPCLMLDSTSFLETYFERRRWNPITGTDTLLSLRD